MIRTLIAVFDNNCAGRLDEDGWLWVEGWRWYEDDYREPAIVFVQQRFYSFKNRKYSMSFFQECVGFWCNSFNIVSILKIDFRFNRFFLYLM